MAFADNLISITPPLSEIKTGTPILKIGNDYVVGGIGGNFIPAGQGGGSASMDFYKCSAVYSDSTWSGYKAVLSDSVYTYDNMLTTRLSYNPLLVIPTVGHRYTDGATMEISPIATDNLPIDAYTKFLILGNLNDRVGNVQINNNGLTGDGEWITASEETAYATIPAYSLPSDVFTQSYDWTFEIKFFAPTGWESTSTQNGRFCLFSPNWGQPPYRFDLLINIETKNLDVGGVITGCGQVVDGYNYFAFSRTSSGDYNWIFNGVKQGSFLNDSYGARTYDCYIFKSTNQNRYGYPFKLKYIRISNCIRTFNTSN